ncbi:MAG: type II secretion system protein [Dehalococcoidia bacterium]
MKFHRKEEGFTLIELLVVIAILGILAAVVIPAVTNFIGEGEEEAGETELHNVSLSVASLMADPSTPIRGLANDGDVVQDPRVSSVVLCDKVGDLTEAELIAMAPAASPAGTQDLSGDDANSLIFLDSTTNGEGLYINDNEAQPLGDYSQKDTTKNWYCVDADGTVHGWLASDGTYIENL